MGRRSINTTKSGKYMNPTDQARKEARKKELKKNKRQRQMVRAAVLKNKDPAQLLEEMEKIDEMEYNVLQPSPLNEKVLRDKRKKLKETFDRVMRLYQTDEPENWAELKRKEVEYEKKRMKKQTYYESVKHAQSVQIEEIPLPAPATSALSSSTCNTLSTSIASGIRIPPPPTSLALPPFAPSAPPSATVKLSEEDKTKRTENDIEIALGVPPGPPPDLFQMRELDSGAESEEDTCIDEVNTNAMSGKKLEEFMQELETEHHNKQASRKEPDPEPENEQCSADAKRPRKDDVHSNSASENNSSESDSVSSDEGDSNDTDNSSNSNKKKCIRKEQPDDPPTSKKENQSQVLEVSTALKPITPTNSMAGAQTATQQPAQSSLLPPPPLHIGRPIMSMPPQMPSIGPPPPPISIAYRPPPLRGPAPLGMAGYAMRMPPVPPHMVGMPPRMRLPMPPGPPPGLPPRMQGAKLGVTQGSQIKEHTKGLTTITAKPQIRNLSADVTRFVPSALRKRDGAKKPTGSRVADYVVTHKQTDREATKPATKDDAYMQFMNELQNLL